MLSTSLYCSCPLLASKEILSLCRSQRKRGRIVFAKRDKLLMHLDVCKKMKLAWKSLGSWEVIPLGKRFYEFAFTSLEDIRPVQAVESYNISLRILRVFTYTKDFVPKIIKLRKVKCSMLCQNSWLPYRVLAIPCYFLYSKRDWYPSCIR